MGPHTYEDSSTNVKYGGNEGLNVAISNDGIVLTFIASALQLKSIQKYFKNLSDCISSSANKKGVDLTVTDYTDVHSVVCAYPKIITNEGSKLVVILGFDMFSTRKMHVKTEQEKTPQLAPSNVVHMDTGEPYFGVEQALSEAADAKTVLIITDTDEFGIDHILSDGWKDERLIYALRKIAATIESEIFSGMFFIEDDFDDD